jgi:hypothetical protein
MKARPLEERFWEKVDKTPHCWEWIGRKDADGYGQFKLRRDKHSRAHRLSYQMANGEIPEGLIVLHTCDNPSCVRPDHLYAGTHQQNGQDRSSRGRYRNRPATEMKRGLTAETVVKIRQDTRNNYVIAKDYGVSESTIRHAKSRYTWSNVP